MRLVKALITGIALLLSLFVGAILVTIGLIIFFLRRLLGRPATMPVFRGATVRATPPRQPRMDQGDVIDVVATEVKD
jgi:hypothetical protein